ncbi:hypothetical protein MMC08_005520 [Hypocenomyce scalaris]|nr:hypothetical protein [Hypocenomyce scalaris]
MRLLRHTLLLALLHLVASTLAIPTTTQASSPLAPRSQFCANAPLTIAGTPYDRRRALPPALPRGNPALITWCAPNSQTYIVIRLGALVAGTAVQTLLAFALADVGLAVNNGRTPSSSGTAGLIPHGSYSASVGYVQTGGSVELTVWNANNHQITWGVLSAAVEAMEAFMIQYGFGEATFSIYDGANEVGEGDVKTRVGQG